MADLILAAIAAPFTIAAWILRQVIFLIATVNIMFTHYRYHKASARIPRGGKWNTTPSNADLRSLRSAMNSTLQLTIFGQAYPRASRIGMNFMDRRGFYGVA